MPQQNYSPTVRLASHTSNTPPGHRTPPALSTHTKKNGFQTRKGPVQHTRTCLHFLPTREWVGGWVGWGQGLRVGHFCVGFPSIYGPPHPSPAALEPSPREFSPGSLMLYTLSTDTSLVQPLNLSHILHQKAPLP